MTQNFGSIWMWRSLHFLLALSLPFIFSALLGCIKAKEEPADLGPEATEDQIDLALSKALHGATLNPSVGQFTTYTLNRRLESEETTLNLGASKAEVFKKDPPDATKPGIETFHMRITQSTRLDDGTFETVQSEQPLEIKSGASVSSTVLALTPSGRAAIMAKPIRRSYHRLVEKSDNIDVPPYVKGKPGCGGMASCKMPVRLVQYDMVDWYNETEFKKLAISLVFSVATPWLPFGKANGIDEFNGLLVNNCISTLAYVVGRTVYVRDCYTLDDFQK